MYFRVLITLSLLLMILSPGICHAQDLEQSGYLRTLFTFGKSALGEEYNSFVHRLHTKVAFYPSASWEFNLELDNTVNWGSYLDTREWQLRKQYSKIDAVDMTLEPWDFENLAYQADLYRGYIRYSSEKLDFSFGRQRIAWGSGRIWNPVDLFNPVDPLRTESDIQTGIDAVQLSLRPADSWQIDIASGARFENERMSHAVKIRKTTGSYDMSVILGSFADRDIVGLDFTGYLGDAGFRGSVIWNDVGSQDFIQLVLSYEYILPNGLDILVEYLYNEDTAGEIGIENPDNSSYGTIKTLNEHYLGIKLGGQLTPLVSISALTIYDIQERSVFAYPFISYSWLQNLDLSIGLQLYLGNEGDFSYGNNRLITLLDYFF